MATNFETVKNDRRTLFMLLRIKKANKGIEVKELDESILAVKAEMPEEDFAYVEKQIAEL